MRTQDLRAVIGWSQSDLAVAPSWSRQKVQRFEAGGDVPLSDEDRVLDVIGFDLGPLGT
jgi:hypothetical protein